MNKYKQVIFLTMLFIMGAVTVCRAAEGKTFEVTDASIYFDVKISVAECGEGDCQGKAEISFFKKGEKTIPYQVINLDETYLLPQSDGTLNNPTLLYSKQSVIKVNDFNFDGMEDVAVCNGRNGGYGSLSYSIYLSSKSAKQFVYNEEFSTLGANPYGMFSVDKKKKSLETWSKSGCCFHIIERFKVVKNRPVKFFKETTDATGADKTKVEITTETLVNGKWKNSVRYEKRKE